MISKKYILIALWGKGTTEKDQLANKLHHDLDVVQIMEWLLLGKCHFNPMVNILHFQIVIDYTFYTLWNFRLRMQLKELDFNVLYRVAISEHYQMPSSRKSKLNFAEIANFTDFRGKNLYVTLGHICISVFLYACDDLQYLHCLIMCNLDMQRKYEEIYSGPVEMA